MTEDDGHPIFPALDGALAEQIHKAGRIAGLQEASEFVGWIQKPESGARMDQCFGHMVNVFAERAKRWWGDISDPRVRSLVAQVPATPWNKKFDEADQSHFTLVFKGNIGDLKQNVYDAETPFGTAARAWIGDAVAEIERLRDLLRQKGINADASLHDERER